ncbi:MAG: hypothetical protein ACLTSG_14300 [Lachnospiraceae bacterium]
MSDRTPVRNGFTIPVLNTLMKEHGRHRQGPIWVDLRARRRPRRGSCAPSSPTLPALSPVEYPRPAGMEAAEKGAALLQPHDRLGGQHHWSLGQKSPTPCSGTARRAILNNLGNIVPPER